MVQFLSADNNFLPTRSRVKPGTSNAHNLGHIFQERECFRVVGLTGFLCAHVFVFSHRQLLVFCFFRLFFDNPRNRNGFSTKAVEITGRLLSLAT